MQFSQISLVTFLAMASSAQANDCTSSFAGYMPRTDATDYWIKDFEQKVFEDIMESESCPDVADAKIEWDSPNDPGFVAGYLKSIPTKPSPESKEWKEYISYYGSNTFHIDWVDAAFNCASTAGFTSEDAGGSVIPHPFDPDFSTAYCGGGSTPGVGVTGAAGAAGTEVVAGKECVGTEESVKKATSYVYGFIEMVQLMEAAIKEAKSSDCNYQKDFNTLPSGECTTAMELWDAAAAIFTGSLEGEEGGLPGAKGAGIYPDRSYGKTLYTLGEKRCRNFETCGPQKGDLGGDKYNTASINSKIMQFFAAGSHAAYSGDNRRMNYFKRKISAKVMVPWVQGTLRYAHRVSDSTTDPISREHKEVAELSTFAFGALPKLWACSTPAAALVEPLVRTGRTFGIGNGIDYVTVKNAFECNYRCLGITCEEVGGLFDGDASERPDAEACKDKDNLSGDIDVATCKKPNSKFNKKCKTYIGKSGISKRTNLDYYVNGL